MKKTAQNKLGELDRQFNFSLNPYPDLKFSSCPDCGSKTGQRKIPLIIHIDPKNLLLLNYTNRYCKKCDLLIGHKHEIEHYLTERFLNTKPDVIGSNYLIFGTVEKKTWRESMEQEKTWDEILKYVHDFKSHQEIRMTMGGWFLDGQEPPERKPSLSTEWIKKN